MILLLPSMPLFWDSASDPWARAFLVCWDQLFKIWAHQTSSLLALVTWCNALDMYSSYQHGESLLQTCIILTSGLLCMNYREGKGVDFVVQWLGSWSQVFPVWISSTCTSSGEAGRSHTMFLGEDPYLHPCESQEHLLTSSSSAKAKSRAVSAGDPSPLVLKGPPI